MNDYAGHTADDLRALAEAAREPLAAYAHDYAWSRWMRYEFSKGTLNPDGTLTLPAWAVERWTRQMNTPYAELPEDERESDRRQADKILKIVEEAARLALPAALDRVAALEAALASVLPIAEGRENVVTYQRFCENLETIRAAYAVLREASHE